MSGGHFNYDQYKIDYIADQIDQMIIDGEQKKEYREFSDETIRRMKHAVDALRIAAVYAQRVDWLVSGDDSEESFLRRLQEDLNKITPR